MPFSALIRRLRPARSDERPALERFVRHACGAIERVRAMGRDWHDLVQLESDAERLANAAAVNRWELVRLLDHQGEPAPRPVAAAQRQVHAAVGDAARAFQLLANGHRSHKSDAVCTGQALLSDALAELDRAYERLAELRARLAPAPSAVPNVSRGSSAS
jgi:hypothetical protein